MEPSRPVTILYFAWLRERLGTAREEMQLPAGVQTLAELLEHLADRDTSHAAVLRNRRTIRFAINQEFADPSAPVRPGDEVALFPPVTGG